MWNWFVSLLLVCKPINRLFVAAFWQYQTVSEQYFKVSIFLSLFLYWHWNLSIAGNMFSFYHVCLAVFFFILCTLFMLVFDLLKFSMSHCNWISLYVSNIRWVVHCWYLQKEINIYFKNVLKRSSASTPNIPHSYFI